MSETVIVFKDKKSREIKTYVNLDGHGAEADLMDFMDLVAEFYGSPATTMTRGALREKLLEASLKAIHEMKSKTRAVAGAVLPSPKKD